MKVLEKKGGRVEMGRKKRESGKRGRETGRERGEEREIG